MDHTPTEETEMETTRVLEILNAVADMQEQWAHDGRNIIALKRAMTPPQRTLWKQAVEAQDIADAWETIEESENGHRLLRTGDGRIVAYTLTRILHGGVSGDWVIELSLHAIRTPENGSYFASSVEAKYDCPLMG